MSDADFEIDEARRTIRHVKTNTTWSFVVGRSGSVRLENRLFDPLNPVPNVLGAVVVEREALKVLSKRFAPSAPGTS
jgi:hypothetical protein